MTTTHDLPPLPELGRPFYGPDVQEYALAAIAPYKAENAKLRALLTEAQPHLETAAEAAEERGIDNGKARQCLARIDAALGEKK